MRESVRALAAARSLTLCLGSKLVRCGAAETDAQTRDDPTHPQRAAAGVQSALT